MDLEFDPAKDAVNVAKHGVSLARAIDFQFQAVQADPRATYGETRYRAFGLLATCTVSPSLSVTVWCGRSASGVRA